MGLKLLAELALDGSGFETGLRKATKALSSVKGLIAGAFSVGAVEELSRRTLDYAGQLNDLSSRLGVSTDFLQEFRYVAKQTGTDLEALTKIMETLRENRDAALSGGPSSAKPLAAFQALGVNPEDLKSKRLEDLISGPIAMALSSGDVQGKLGAAWRDLAGKSAGALLAGFTDGFNELRQQAHEQTRIWTEDQIQQMDDIGDQFAVLSDRLLLEWGSAMLTMIDWVRRFGNAVAQFGAEWGARTSNITGKEAVQAPLGWLTKDSYSFWQKLFDPKNIELGEKAGMQVAQDFAEKMQGEFDARLKKRQLRENARKGGGDVTPVEINEPQKKKEAYKFNEPDDLTRVGNFLGASQGSISYVGEKTNQILTNMRGILETIAANTARKAITEDRSLWNDGDVFPPNVG